MEKEDYTLAVKSVENTSVAKNLEEWGFYALLSYVRGNTSKTYEYSPF